MAQRELYFISGSPPCWTVMLALAVKQLDYHQRRLDNSRGDQKNPDFLNINPRGLVPVLTDGDITVCETLAVLAYLDAACPDPPLFGTEPVETGRIWQAICDCDGNLRGPAGDISRPLFRGRAQQAAQRIEQAATTVREELGLLEARTSAGPWLAGETLSAADIIVYPVLMQLLRAVARDDATSLELAIHPLGDHFPGLDSWRRRVETVPGYDDAYPPHWK